MIVKILVCRCTGFRSQR